MMRFKNTGDLPIGIFGVFFCLFILLGCLALATIAILDKKNLILGAIIFGAIYALLVGLVSSVVKIKDAFRGRLIIDEIRRVIIKGENSPWLFRFSRVEIDISHVQNGKIRKDRSTGYIEPTYDSNGKILHSGHYITADTYHVELLVDGVWLEFDFQKYIDAKNFLQRVVDLSGLKLR